LSINSSKSGEKITERTWKNLKVIDHSISREAADFLFFLLLASEFPSEKAWMDYDVILPSHEIFL